MLHHEIATRDYWEMVEEQDAAIIGQDLQFLELRPPNGRYVILNNAGSFAKIKEKILAASRGKVVPKPLIIQSAKPRMTRTNASADKVILEFIKNEEDANAANMSGLRGRPIFFGVGDDSSSIPYVACKFESNDGITTVIGCCHRRHKPNLSSKPKSAMLFSVIEESTGLTIGTCASSEKKVRKSFSDTVETTPNFDVTVKKAVDVAKKVIQADIATKWFKDNGVHQFDYAEWRCRWDPAFKKPKFKKLQFHDPVKNDE